MDRTMSSSPWPRPRWTTQVNYHSNCTHPSMFFCFVFVSHSEHHKIQAIILEIQNPSFEIERDPSDVPFFNIDHEERREIDNIKCPVVHRLTQIYMYLQEMRTHFKLHAALYTYLRSRMAKPFFLFFTNFLILYEFKIYHGVITTMIAYHRFLWIKIRAQN